MRNAWCSGLGTVIGMWSFKTPFLTLWNKLANQEATISSHSLQTVPQKLMTYIVHTYRLERAHTQQHTLHKTIGILNYNINRYQIPEVTIIHTKALACYTDRNKLYKQPTNVLSYSTMYLFSIFSPTCLGRYPVICANVGIIGVVYTTPVTHITYSLD